MGGENCLVKNCHSSQRCKHTLKVHTRMPETKSIWNSDVCAYAINCRLQRTLMLFVVKSAKLHLTACRNLTLNSSSSACTMLLLISCLGEINRYVEEFPRESKMLNEI